VNCCIWLCSIDDSTMIYCSGIVIIVVVVNAGPDTVPMSQEEQHSMSLLQLGFLAARVRSQAGVCYLRGHAQTWNRYVCATFFYPFVTSKSLLFTFQPFRVTLLFLIFVFFEGREGILCTVLTMFIMR